MPKEFRKVLVANRGEIAVRVMRTVREMGMSPVAVYSEADRGSLHVRMADEAYPIGPAAAAESYLLPDRILDAAKRAGADAIHPGYGFLSENAAFSDACEKAGIAFVGPPASSMIQMGSKTAARAVMEAAGVPVIPGATCDTTEEATRAAEKIGFPVMLKASAGGGGKGMRLVQDAKSMPAAWERARSEAKKFFGDDTVYIEKAIIRPRHVEIQVLGDCHGNMVHLFERDCSIQRRNQKVVEETPSPGASRELVQKMGEIAVQGAKAVGYFSAGTFEFLLAPDGHFYFLEMNTRLQVEHPITEWVTGVDLVRCMLDVAQGRELPFAQSDLASRGASIECRVYAEDPTRDFVPSPGPIDHLVVPGGPGVRDDGGVVAGGEVSSFYDPLISKLSVWAPTRERALDRMARALSEYVVTGIQTNIAFHEALMRHPAFAAGKYDTGFLGQHLGELIEASSKSRDDEAMVTAAIAAAIAHEDHGMARSRTAAPAGPSPWVMAQRAARRARP